MASNLPLEGGKACAASVEHGNKLIEFRIVVTVKRETGTMSGKFTRSGRLLKNLAILLCVGAGMALIAPVASADVSGGIGQNFFNGFTINEGQSGAAVLQLFVSGANSSGFAGTTTHRINGGNGLTFSAPGSTVGAQVTGTGGDFGNGTANWSSSFQYNLPGVYNISYGGTVSWLHSANASFSTGNYSGTGFQGVGSNVNVTVNNVAPTITSANLNGLNSDISVGQGSAVSANMTATDAGSQNTNFTINSGGAGSIAGTPGSTRTSTTVAASIGLAPGVYAQTFQADDGTTTASNGPIVRNVTVTNVAPTITSANQDGVNGNITVLQGASVTLNLTATDPGNDTMSFTINGGGAGSTGVQAGGSTRTSADNAVQYFTPGTFTNTFQATDQYGANASNGPASREVTVLNVAPVITSLLATELPNLAGNGCLMFFTATSTDPGILDSALYSWDLNGDNIFGDYVSADPAPPWSSTTPTILYGLGTHTIGVMVSDNWGGFDPINGVAYLTFECLPEPSTWVAIMLSGGALAFFHRRKKRKA
jgi:hypothetical protein